MRLFVAIDLEEEIKDKLTDIIASLRKEDVEVKWVERENLHITLKFLGEVREENVKAIEDSVEGVIKNMKKFKISLEGVGYFGSPNYIRIVWVDVKEGREEVKELMERLNEALNQVRKDDFPPAAHLTIGRVRSPKNKYLLLETIQEMKDVKFGECEVKEIKLKQSVLGREGPQYSNLKVFSLG